MFKLFKRKKKKIGLCLGGGGTKGFAHLGAIKAFEEYGIKFDEVAGTSIGSIVGAMYCAGLTFNDMYKVSQKVQAKEIRKSKAKHEHKAIRNTVPFMGFGNSRR